MSWIAWGRNPIRSLGYEELFAAFLFAGAVKDTVVLSWLPFDLTLAFMAASIGLGLRRLALAHWTVTRAGLMGIAPMLVLVFYAGLSLIWSPSRDYSYTKFALLAVSCGWAFIGSVVLAASGEHAQFRFFRACAIIATIVACQFLALTSGLAMGATAHWSDTYLGYGRLFCMGFVIVLASGLWSDATGARLSVIFLALVPLGLGLLLGGGRGPLVALLVASTIPVVRGLRMAGNRLMVEKRLVVLAAAFIVVSIAVLVLDPAGTHLKTVRRIVAFLTDGNPHSVGARLAYYRDSLEAWRDSPIWGVGLGGWPVKMGWGDVRGYPHNILLEVVVELGIIGLVLLVFILLLGFAAPLVSRSLPRRTVLTTVMLVVAALVNASFSGDLTDNKMLFGVVGLGIGCATRRRQEAEVQVGAFAP